MRSIMNCWKRCMAGGGKCMSAPRYDIAMDERERYRRSCGWRMCKFTTEYTEDTENSENL